MNDDKHDSGRSNDLEALKRKICLNQYLWEKKSDEKQLYSLRRKKRWNDVLRN